MTITTTAAVQTTTDVDLIAALEASPDFTVVTDGTHLAQLLGIQVPSAAALEILNDTETASGIERGIVAAGVIERIVPSDVEIEEYNIGAQGKTRSVYLIQDGVEHIGINFLDRTHEVALHIDSDDPDTVFHGFVTPAEMFDMIRAYWR
jgi:hypothetical protein